MITSVSAFADYFEGVRQRTRGFVGTVPADRVGIIRAGRLIDVDRACELMFVGAVVDGAWRYPGHDREVAPTLQRALAHLDAGHAQATAQLRTLADGALHETRPPLEPGARPVRAWRLLLAMTEHEVHHRSQLASYLTWMGVEPPDIFGLGVEDVERLTAHAAGRER